MKIENLTSLSNKYDCDKSTVHNYMDYYEIFFKEFKDDSFNLFEIGIDVGKSYNVWKEYFNNANIFGMDLDTNFIDDRGQVFKGDQSNINDLSKISNNFKTAKIIIDDGSHVPDHQLMCFEYLFKHILEDGGYYVIEDIECSYWNPNSEIYGYKSGYLNIIDYFTKYNHHVNHHYNGGENPLNIKMISYIGNSIIIRKGYKDDLTKRDYRFNYMW